VAEMKSVGATSVEVRSDGSEYGRVLADAVKKAFGSSTSGTAAVFYAGTPGSAATKALDGAVASNPNVKLFAYSGLDDDAFVSGLSPQAQQHLYVSAPGFTSGSLSTGGQTFLSDFKSSYGHAPSS